MPKYSIVIPVYNAAPYLAECLDSVLAQTVQDYEVLLIDDGSTDGSADIIDQYSVQNPSRFIVRHNENRGASAVRNQGIDMAQGEYICFIDADDILDSNYLEALTVAMTDEVDSVMGGFKTFGLPDKPGRTISPSSPKVKSLEENLLDFYEQGNSLSQKYIWNRMFRTSVIRNHNIRFDEDIFYKEDGLFLVRYLCRSNGMVGVTDKVVYRYRRTPNGAMGSAIASFNPKLMTNLTAHGRIIEELKNKSVSPEILSLAIAQVKAVANWIQGMLHGFAKERLRYLLLIEKQMIEIIGIRFYFLWRCKKIFTIWK